MRAARTWPGRRKQCREAIRRLQAGPVRLAGELIPIYGDGGNVRDWLNVEDHADALLTGLVEGAVGRSYNIGGENKSKNIDLVRFVCAELDRLRSG